MQPWVLFLIFGALFFLMMRSGCGSHVSGHGHGGHGRGEPGEAPRWHPPEKDLDPVCGMSVQTKVAKSTLYEGHVYHFCSTTCRDKFEASPAKYVHAQPQEHSATEHQHG